MPLVFGLSRVRILEFLWNQTQKGRGLLHYKVLLQFLQTSHLADVESSVFEILCQHRRRVSAVKTRRSHPRIAATSRDNHLESNRQHRNIYWDNLWVQSRSKLCMLRIEAFRWTLHWNSPSKKKPKYFNNKAQLKQNKTSRLVNNSDRKGFMKKTQHKCHLRVLSMPWIHCLRC
jgi:hypothetical protein